MNDPRYVHPLPRLFCKPISESAHILYQQFIPALNTTLSFRSLDLVTDSAMIHDWVNQSYARRFWQLNGSKDLIRSTYEAILLNPRAHSFIGLLNNQPICQIDAYAIIGDELETHVSASEYDGGIHLLMLPPKQLQKGWSYYALKTFQQFYFSFQQPQQLFAEPDQENVYANKLALDAGFHFLRTIQLSNKTANLYSISRE
jgi:hypothetical protein